MERKFHGAKVPSMELSLPGAKVRGNESSIIPKLCMQGGRGWQGWQRQYSYFVAASAAVIMTAAMSVAKSHRRQTARVAEGLPDSRWGKINPKL